MDLHHEFTVPSDIDTVWSTLLDLERVGGCFPGATVTEANDEGFKGNVKVKLGPISLVYAGSGTFVERDASAHRAVIEAKGKDKRGNGTAGATVTMALSEGADGPESTLVSVDTDLAIKGKPAQFGRGVMQDVSDKLLEQFVGCIQSQFDEPSDDASAEAPHAAAESESAAAEAASAGGASGVAAAGAGSKSSSASGGSSSGAAPASDEPVYGSSPAGSAAGAASGASAGGAPADSRAARKAARPAPKVDDAIDLGAVALPSAVKQWGPYAIGAVIGLLLGYLLGRKRH